MNHKMMFQILIRYGAPPKLCSAIGSIYTDLRVILKVVKIEELMPQTIGLRQGDFMAPALFLFMVMAFTETIEKMG